MVAQQIQGIIFDLDGVIVSTDECHYSSWKRVADEEGIHFNREINNRLRGVSRMESLEILLEKSDSEYTQEEKIQLTERKNGYYRELIQELSPGDILPGINNLLHYYREKGFKLAIASSSKNAPMILQKIGLSDFFDAVVDGNCITRSKPDPEVFLKAAEALGLKPENCLVVEDADAGVEAALRGNMNVMKV